MGGRKAHTNERERRVDVRPTDLPPYGPWSSVRRGGVADDPRAPRTFLWHFVPPWSYFVGTAEQQLPFARVDWKSCVGGGGERDGSMIMMAAAPLICRLVGDLCVCVCV